MLKLYTCYKCCFQFKADENHIPPRCPACNCTPEWYISEPYNKEEKRRIHIDPPEAVDEERALLDISYHVAKKFPAHSMNGRLRRFVFQYSDPGRAKKDYEELMDWDIIPCEESDPAHPTLFCATGPGNPNWEPKFPSFIYGFFKDKETDETGKSPLFMIEVDHLEHSIEQVIAYGGALLKPRYSFDKNEYAIVEDSEGNAMYLWETPGTVTWEEPEAQGG